MQGNRMSRRDRNAVLLRINPVIWDTVFWLFLVGFFNARFYYWTHTRRFYLRWPLYPT